ncbi:hypothetical protein N7520_003945 [Penicillium odoratum]|uniref:uncharacterized protein n=1 Tax=Penicillium odoratum TaxID=1167516 RepID=UPI002546C3E3|nr:uncharacterized protein N7520_003945 [Penicillium odoratum]KAJ5769386.1 hypothetical protein N7520_003945 [Penicillium odoratum]
MGEAVDAKLLRQTKFPPEFNHKVNLKKVNIEVIKKWIAGRINEILANEDDVIIEFCYSLLEAKDIPDIKSMQIQLTGFLDKDTPKFCKDLWLLLLSAQENPQGVPKELLEAKKLELMQEKYLKLEAEKAAEAARQQREQDMAREALAVLLTIPLSAVDDRGHLATEAVIDTVNPPLAASSIPTSHLEPAEVALTALLLAPLLADLDPLVDAVLGLPTAAEPDPPTRAIAQETGAAQTTVNDTDSLTSMNHSAHEFPEEMNAPSAQSPAA